MKSRLSGVVLIGLAAAMVACTHQPTRKTVTICDAAGCAARDADHSVSAPAPSAEEAEAARQLVVLQALAEQDARAAYDLGLRYFRGDGVRQNSHQALQWMRSAGERGDFEAQKALGRFYLTGLEEMGADPREAERWLTIAAGRGDEESRQLLADATAAKRSDQAWYEWRRRWHPVFYGYWYSGYRYRTYWHNGYWRYY